MSRAIFLLLLLFSKNTLGCSPDAYACTINLKWFKLEITKTSGTLPRKFVSINKDKTMVLVSNLSSKPIYRLKRRVKDEAPLPEKQPQKNSDRAESDIKPEAKLEEFTKNWRIQEGRVCGSNGAKWEDDCVPIEDTCGFLSWNREAFEFSVISPDSDEVSSDNMSSRSPQSGPGRTKKAERPKGYTDTYTLDYEGKPHTLVITSEWKFNPKYGTSYCD